MINRRDIQSKIEILEAVNNIKKLKFSYWNACDFKNPTAMVECFLPDKVHIDFEDFGIFNSAQDMVNKFQQNSCHEHLLEKHSGKNPVINLLSNNEASGFWSLSYNLIDIKKSFCLNVNGTYEDIYRKNKNGNWLIQDTVFKKIASAYTSVSSEHYSKPRIGRSLWLKKTV